MKIMITGANGLLGQKLVQKLSTDPRKNVIATARGTNRNPVGNYTYHTMDIADEQQVASIVDQLRPDVIINTAAMTQVDDCERDQDLCRCLNVEAVRYLVKACDLSNVFLIHLSTDFIFDGAAGPYTEEDEPNPLSYYGQSKLDAEQIIKSSPIRWAIARTMLVYGIAHDMSRSNIILWVKKNLEQGSPIRVVNDQWRMPTLAEDLADGCIAIAEKTAQGVFNISGKDMLSPYDMALATADFFALDKNLIEEVDGSIFTQLAKRPAKTGLSLEKSRRVLSYDPHSFDEGLSVLASQLD